MFLTFFARPGYNISLLRHFGFNSELDLFRGKHALRNDTVHIHWGNASSTIQGEQRSQIDKVDEVDLVTAILSYHQPTLTLLHCFQLPLLNIATF